MKTAITILAVLACLPLFALGLLCIVGVDFISVANRKFRPYRPVS